MDLIPPIWSVDRNSWIQASDLHIGERVKTRNGIASLKSKSEILGKQPVYNLEVYRDHNYLVSTDEILVHNSSILKLAKKYGINAKSEITKQLLENFDMRASDWLGKYRKGSIKSVLGETGEKTIGEVFDAADSQTRKMILDGRFAK